MRSAADLASKLRAVLTQEENGLRSISEQAASERPGGGPGWIRKQELGHLLDSATNNRVRFVSAALAGEYSGPSYLQNGWVQLGGYEDFSWSLLLDCWFNANELLATAIARIPDARLSASCSIANQPCSLHFLIVDYILHVQHHLDHLLDRAEITVYPGAVVGV